MKALAKCHTHQPAPLIFVLVLAVAFSASPLPLAIVRAQGDSRLFPETGKTVEGRFLDY